MIGARVGPMSALPRSAQLCSYSLSRRCSAERENVMHRLLSPLLLLAIASGCNNGLDHDSEMKGTSSALTGAGVAHAMISGSSASGQLDATLQTPLGTGSAPVVR